MGTALVTGPALEPVTLVEAKAHCRIDIEDDDGLLAGFLLSARQHAETYLRRSLITQTWDLFIDREWPTVRCGGSRVPLIEIPRPPLQSVTSVTYYDSDGTLQTLASNQYRVSTKRHEGIIEPAYGVTWPSVRDQADTIVVRFVAGYGSLAGDIPEAIRQGILLLVGHWYQNRETVNVGNISSELPFTTEALWFPHRVFY